MSEKAYEGWAILELMGHRRLGGYVSEVELAGSRMLRIDVHRGEETFTQFYGGGSVYCLTPTTEEIARGVAAISRAAPVQPWELPKQLPVNTSDSDDGETSPDPGEIF